MNCALIDDNGKVVNMIVADPDKDVPAKGYGLVAMPAGKPIDQRWEWSAKTAELQPGAILQAQLDDLAANPPPRNKPTA